ncbi:MAG: thioredoxin domain-containing protein [SAR324 cluster bacterium]|nr:thioredoxin domain-containing protein [SAR324 cluster bacterium]
MANEKVIHLNDPATFEEQTKEGYALVDFWAGWCGPCLALAPTIDSLADQYAGQLKVCKVDVDSNQDSAAKFGVRGIPFIALLKDGKLVDSVTGNDPTRVQALAEMAVS